MPSGYEHNLGVFVIEDFLVVGCGIGKSELISSALCAQTCRRAYAGKSKLPVHTRLLTGTFSGRQQHASSEVTGAYKTDADLITGYRFSSGFSWLNRFLFIGIRIFENHSTEPFSA